MNKNEVKKINRNDTLNNLKTHKTFDISKIIVNHGLNNNLSIRNNNNISLILFIKKIRTIILSLIITSIVISASIIVINYLSETKKKSVISFNQNLNNNTDNIDGYFIPKDRLLNPSFKKCSIDNCKRCYGNSYKDTCISCFNSYNPIRDENNTIISCVYNPPKEEVSNKILNESDKINITELNNENKIEASSIVDNSDEIKIEQNKSDKINITELNYENKNEATSIVDNTDEIKIEQNKSDISENISTILTQKITNYSPEIKTELMQTTFIEGTPHTTSIAQVTTSNVVIECNPGYYYPGGENECKKCSAKGCKECHGNTAINFCDSCYSEYIPRYIDNILICFEPDKNCILFNYTTFQCMKCPNEYIIFENNCIAYSIEASYYTNEENLNVKLINLDMFYIDKIIIDGEILNSYNSPVYNIFPNIGIHKVYYIFKNNLTSFSNLFYNCKNLISVNFTSNIKTGNIVDMKNMFGFCTSLISINFSKFDTFYVTDMSNMFDSCYSLTSINLTNFETDNVIFMNAMFRDCISLKSISLQNFHFQRVVTFAFMFHNCSSLISINLPTIFFNYYLQLKYTNNMFSNCTNLSYADLNNLNFSNVENTESMFEGCIVL